MTPRPERFPSGDEVGPVIMCEFCGESPAVWRGYCVDCRSEYYDFEEPA